MILTSGCPSVHISNASLVRFFQGLFKVRVCIDTRCKISNIKSFLHHEGMYWQVHTRHYELYERSSGVLLFRKLFKETEHLPIEQGKFLRKIKLCLDKMRTLMQQEKGNNSKGSEFLILFHLAKVSPEKLLLSYFLPHQSQACHGFSHHLLDMEQLK